MITFENVMAMKEAIASAVKFYTDELGGSSSPMIAREFHLPFEIMQILLKKPYYMEEGKSISSFKILSPEFTNFSNKSGEFSIVIPDYSHLITFKILEEGEIEIRTLDSDKYSLEKVIEMSQEEARDAIITRHDKYLYNFVYDMLATIDNINHSEYVVTPHTTDRATGERLPDGRIEHRIKLRRIKYHHPDQSKHKTGTKHRYKYRVRGHWRTIEGGKEIWIHNHVRGGDGTIFISKEYEL